MWYISVVRCGIVLWSYVTWCRCTIWHISVVLCELQLKITCSVFFLTWQRYKCDNSDEDTEQRHAVRSRVCGSGGKRKKSSGSLCSRVDGPPDGSADDLCCPSGCHIPARQWELERRRSISNTLTLLLSSCARFVYSVYMLTLLVSLCARFVTQSMLLSLCAHFVAQSMLLSLCAHFDTQSIYRYLLCYLVYAHFVTQCLIEHGCCYSWYMWWKCRV